MPITIESFTYRAEGEASWHTDGFDFVFWGLRGGVAVTPRLRIGPGGTSRELNGTTIKVAPVEADSVLLVAEDVGRETQSLVVNDLQFPVKTQTQLGASKPFTAVYLINLENRTISLVQPQSRVVPLVGVGVAALAVGMVVGSRRR